MCDSLSNGVTNSVKDWKCLIVGHKRLFKLPLIRVDIADAAEGIGLSQGMAYLLMDLQCRLVELQRLLKLPLITVDIADVVEGIGLAQGISAQTHRGGC